MNIPRSEKVSIVLPAFNEAKEIEKTVLDLRREMESINPRFEIIIAEDGSTDGTDMIASRLAKKYTNVIHLHNDKKLGRGRALNRAFKKSKGDIMLYMDVDLATDLNALKRLIDEIRSGADISTGSRYAKGNKANRTFKRRFFSLGFNYMVRLLLDSKVMDHQCGFKSFKRKTILPILDEIESPHWFWDTEILVKAQQKGLKVTEFPVKWKEGKDTKVRMKNDIIGMGSKAIKLWFDTIFKK